MKVFRTEFESFLADNDKMANTIASYISDLELFTYDEISTDTAKAYVVQLQDAGMAISTINRKLVSLKQYIKFLTECKNTIITLKVRQLKQQKQNYLDDVLTEKDFNSLMKSAEAKGDFRARAIFCTLCYTGMRVSEMLQFKIGDASKGNVTIKGKGGKYREVFISKKLQKVLKEYADIRLNNSDSLFTGKRGAINRKTVDAIIKEHAGYIRLKGTKAHAHNFRHLFCKLALERGLGIDTVADLAGHSDINTTRIYTRKSKQELMAAINSL